MPHLFHRFFLALLPPPELLPAFRRHRGPHGRAVADARLHVTMAWLGDFAGPQPALLERLRGAFRDATPPAAAVTLDRLVVAAARRLLVASAPQQAVRELHDRLLAGLADAGIGWMKARFSPHVTLGYGREPATGARPIDPIGWRAGELTLIESLLGRGRHVAHARWALESHTTM